MHPLTRPCFRPDIQARSDWRTQAEDRLGIDLGDCKVGQPVNDSFEITNAAIDPRESQNWLTM